MTYTAPSEERITLSEQFEAACNLAAKLYAEGVDTTEVDAEVERLMALLND